MYHPEIRELLGPANYKWSYNPYEWSYKSVIGLMIPISGVFLALLKTGDGAHLLVLS